MNKTDTKVIIFSIETLLNKFIDKYKKELCLNGDENTYAFNSFKKFLTEKKLSDSFITFIDLQLVSFMNLLSEKNEVYILDDIDFLENCFCNGNFKEMNFRELICPVNERKNPVEFILNGTDCRLQEIIFVDIDYYRALNSIKSKLNTILFVDLFRLERELILQEVLI